MKRRTLPCVVDSGEVVAVKPAVLTGAAAGLYMGMSASKLEQLRAADTRASREGRSLAGPKWIVIAGTMIRYRLADLDDWLRATAKELGTAESYRRSARGAEP